MDIFAELEVLVKTKAKTLHIIRCLPVGYVIRPDGLHHFATFQWPDGMFPLVAVDDLVAFDDTAAGKTEKAGFEVGQFLDEVGTQAAFAVFPGIGREQTNPIDIQLASSFED